MKSMILAHPVMIFFAALFLISFVCAIGAWVFTKAEQRAIRQTPVEERRAAWGPSAVRVITLSPSAKKGVDHRDPHLRISTKR